MDKLQIDSLSKVHGLTTAKNMLIETFHNEPWSLKKKQLFMIGDSWFATWPAANNVAGQLSGSLYDVRSTAVIQTTLKQLNQPGGQLESLVKGILSTGEKEKSLIRAIIVSCCANDVVDDATKLPHSQLPLLVNTFQPGQPFLNEAEVYKAVDQELRALLGKTLSSLVEACKNNNDWSVPILIHGYDYPIPDGIDTTGLKRWLSKPLIDKGYADLAMRKQIMKDLIDRLNAMQIDLIKDPYFNQVSHLDLRGTLSSNDADYKEYWQDELHPSNAKGYPLIAAKFVERLKQFGPVYGGDYPKM
jgi:lysophospholipase L1-like esterase